MNNLRIPQNLWDDLASGLLVRRDVETAGIILAERFATESGHILVARSANVWPDTGYTIRESDRIQLDPIAINRVTRPARDNGWSIITIHTHPNISEAWFSNADNVGDSQLMPSFSRQIPSALHGSMVLTGNGRVVARLFDGTAQPMEMSVTIVGDRILRLDPADIPFDERFARQVLALGKNGQRQIRNLRFGVVGIGGIGSVVFAQLAHLGAGEILIMDGDVTSRSNLSRMIGARIEDIDNKKKVHVAVRYASEAELPSKVLAYPHHLATDHHLQILTTCDIIVSCVDRHTPRSLLNRLAYNAAIPIIDLGTGFKVDDAGVMAGDAGRVVVIGPGKPCLGCWGHLDSDALRVEAMCENERESLAAEGYIAGAVVDQPSVMPFNTMVAGAGVVEVLRMVTGFAGMEAPPKRLAFSFRDGTVRRNALAFDNQCRICGNNVISKRAA